MLQQVFNISSVYINDRKDKVKNIPAFLNRMSTLIEEGYTFADSIYMLLPYHVKQVDRWRSKIQDSLRNGTDVVEILKQFSIPNHYLIAIKLAEMNGDLVNALRTVSKQMDFHEKTKNKIGRLLIYPTFLLLVLTSIFIAFRTFFLPNIEQIIESRTEAVHQESLVWSKIFLHLPDISFLLFTIITLSFCTFFLFIKNKPINIQMKLFLSIPIINYIYKVQMTKQFANILGRLITGGFSLQQSLKLLKDQKLNQHLQYIAQKIEISIIHGESLSRAVYLSEYFFPKFEDFILHGEKSGYLGRELQIYSDLLEEKIFTIVKTCLSFVQPLFFFIIGLSIVAAYLSILLPMYNLIEIV